MWRLRPLTRWRHRTRGRHPRRHDRAHDEQRLGPRTNDDQCANLARADQDVLAKRWHGRRVRALRPLAADDSQLLRAVSPVGCTLTVPPGLSMIRGTKLI
jgi:hypothetical protein